jgi:hypothetical protein
MTGVSYVTFTGMKAGLIKIIGSGQDVSSGTVSITVLPSTFTAKIDICISTPIYMPSFTDITLVPADSGNNTVTGYNGPVRLRITAGNNEVTYSSMVVVKGSRPTKVTVYFSRPGKYIIETIGDNVQTTRKNITVLLNKNVENQVNVPSDYGNIKVKIPQGAFINDGIIEITKVTRQSLDRLSLRKMQMNKDNDWLMETTLVSILAKDSDGNNITLSLTADKSIELSIPYPDNEKPFGIVDGTNIDVSRLGMWSYDAAVQKWSLENVTSIDKEQNFVTAHVTKLGMFAIMAISKEPVIDKVVLYPNPFGETTRVGLLIGADAEIKFSVYTVTGRLVKETGMTVTDIIIAGDTKYVDFVYDGSDNNNNILANGTYIYKITAVNGSSNSKYTKIGKFTKVK